MKIIAPSYYGDFHCIAGECRHTCCEDWEVEIDGESLARYGNYADISEHIDPSDTPHFRLLGDERCPFLNGENLCELILKYGEDILCQTCRDHPRFRNFWTDRTEMGLGLVCEEAGRIILSREEPMTLTVLSDDGEDIPLPEDETWLLNLRDELLRNISFQGPEARLMEYLIYRHLPDALYDDRVEERIAFINSAFAELTAAWKKTDGSIEALAEIARAWSYDVEYDGEELEGRIAAFEK